MSKRLETIWQGMQSGTLDATDLLEITVDDGQSLQLQVLETYLKTGEKLSGYKVGLTSGAARDAFGAGVRPFGYILQSRTFPSGASVNMASIGRLGLENELVFRIAADITGADITAADVHDAIEEVAPAFEINQARIAGRTSNGVRVADNLSQWGLVTGDFVSIDRDFEDLTVSLSRDGDEVQSIAAKGHIDNHFESIATLARELRKHKRHLRHGQLVITGSFTRIKVDSPGTYVGDFGELGSVTVEVAG